MPDAPQEPVKGKKRSLDEKRRQDCKAGLERLRNAIRSLVEPKHQSKFIMAVDQMEQQIMRGEIDLDSLQGSIQQTKGQTRRSLRARPIDMVQILNALDGIEQEIVDFFRSISGK